MAVICPKVNPLVNARCKTCNHSIPHVFQHEAGCDYENSCPFALKTVCRELSETEMVMLRLRGVI